MLFLIQSVYSITLVYTPGTPAVPHFCGPKLTTPSKYQVPETWRISGPPESPLQVSLPRTPPAQICEGLRKIPPRANIGAQSSWLLIFNSTFSFLSLADAVSVLPHPAA
uniref:Putative secreted protein n=1 Tax=Anopheles triannulatus TaxID=58253 RepID=A0A2M4B3D1_9DIPT